MKCCIATAACLLAVALASTEADMAFSTVSIQAMEKVFRRSDEEHTRSMDRISASLTTTDKAIEALQKRNISVDALMQVGESSVVRHSRHSRHSRLRRAQPKGYSGVDGAKTLLNDMIYESSMKYDAEIAKCTAFYSAQCALLTEARGEISGANFMAAESRSVILDAQSKINRCEVDIPAQETALKDHNSKCKRDLAKMKARLNIILADIKVLTFILTLTDCDKKMLLEEDLRLMRCEDNCTGTSFLSFKHEGLAKKIRQLQSSSSIKLADEVMSDMYDGIGGLEQVAFTEEKADDSEGEGEGEGKTTPAPTATKLSFSKTNPPVPRTLEPANPCTDKLGGAPGRITVKKDKCTLGKSPKCFKLQERFLAIQSGIMDNRDDLMKDIANTHKACEDTKATFEAQIAEDKQILDESQVQLASGTSAEAEAGAKAMTTGKEFAGLKSDLHTNMKSCNKNYLGFETELCALKKIRGELYKMQGVGKSKSFFVDCKMTKWRQEECTKKCGGGTQKLVRGEVTMPQGGAKCLPKVAKVKCNEHPCPVDCSLEAWAGWSKCSAECGGGVKQRVRTVNQAAKFGGKPCAETSETTSCNGQACEGDCKLSKWSKWSKCSKLCDGGTRKRQKWVTKKAVGDGKCPGAWSKERLEFKKCAMRRCFIPKLLKKIGVMPCNAKLDVVMLLDGSGSLKKKGWDAEMKAANLFIDAFATKKADKVRTQLSVIAYSGPRTYGGVRRCIGGKRRMKLSKCGIQMVTHFTRNMKKVRQLVNGLEWMKGSTLTSLALSTAKEEFKIGRKNAKSIAVVFTDGRPFSYGKTRVAARELRKSARLMWVPITRRAPLAFIKQTATRRWQENVVLARTYRQLASPKTITHIIADMCPVPKRRSRRKGLLRRVFR